MVILFFFFTLKYLKKKKKPLIKNPTIRKTDNSSGDGVYTIFERHRAIKETAPRIIAVLSQSPSPRAVIISSVIYFSATVVTRKFSVFIDFFCRSFKRIKIYKMSVFEPRITNVQDAETLSVFWRSENVRFITNLIHDVNNYFTGQSMGSLHDYFVSRKYWRFRVIHPVGNNAVLKTIHFYVS